MLTDNEIIKALYNMYCATAYKDTITMSKETAIGLYEYFNRQKAEIERLEKQNCSVIEHLKKARRQLKIAQDEAIKEFAERLIADLELLAKHEDELRQSVILGVVHTIEAKKKAMVGEYDV